jgi:hypothetical protein
VHPLDALGRCYSGSPNHQAGNKAEHELCVRLGTVTLVMLTDGYVMQFGDYRGCDVLLAFVVFLRRAKALSWSYWYVSQFCSL